MGKIKEKAPQSFKGGERGKRLGKSKGQKEGRESLYRWKEKAM